jgi:hypothetical protein
MFLLSTLARIAFKVDGVNISFRLADSKKNLL